MRTRNKVMEELLRVLVKEWGHQAVRQALNDIEGTTSAALAGRSGREERSGRASAGPGAGRERHKLNPVEQIAKMELPDSKKAVLLALASHFEKRLFLPTTADVKNFLEINHASAGILHGRDRALSKVLHILVGLSEESLGRMLQDDTHSGPARLGPLSEAIRSTRAAIRSDEAASQSAVDLVKRAKATVD